MDKYLDLGRRFGLLTKDTPAELFASDVLGKGLTWDRVLEGRFSVIIARANFGKTMELKERSRALRASGKLAVFVALHKVLGAEVFAEALEAEDEKAFEAWQQGGGKLTVFVDSLDEASLGTEDGLRKALGRVSRVLDWPNLDIRWVLSSRPAVLTSDVLEQLQAELRTTLHAGSNESASDDDKPAKSASTVPSEQAAAPTNLNAVDAGSKVENTPVQHEQLKVYALLPLNKAAAALYLSDHSGVSDPKATLSAAWQYGLGRLSEGPGGLDILAYIDPAASPPHDLTAVFSKMVNAVQQQQRTDPREQRVGSPPPESLNEAIERLASASAVCQLPNIEISAKALRFREGVLSARPVIASLLSEQSLAYLLGSRLFIDSGQHQVKVYPEELLPFLAARRLAGLVKSPEDAHRLLANFTWRATTGESGVYRALLPLAGWLATLSDHCRQELLSVDPQAVAFFGDLRNPQVQLVEVEKALEGAIERLVSSGDSLGRSHYTLTDENYWQAGKPGVEPALRRLFEKYGADRHARAALLDIAAHASLETFHDVILNTHGRDYSKLIDEQIDLKYILVLGRPEDLSALADSLRSEPGLSESRTARLLSELAWKALDARSIASIAAEQFRAGHGGVSLDWALTRNVADEASDVELYKLTRSLLLRLVNSKVGPGYNADRHKADQKFVELVMDLLALVIKRSAVRTYRVAKLCLVLNRFVHKHHHGDADTKNLRAALEANKPVRLAFLRGLIHPTDKTANGILMTVCSYHPLCPVVDGDEVAIGVPGFTELVEERRRRVAAPPPAAPTRRARGLKIDKKSKVQLQAMVDGLRDGSKEGALAWVAGRLTRSNQWSRYYSECNFPLFEQATGAEVAEAVRTGLGVLWRSKEPTWKEDEPNSTYSITIAGLQGLHLDLGDGSKLPPLNESEVRLAIRYAQFEINGYPKWFWPLVRAHERVASEEFEAILGRASLGRVSSDKAETLIRHLDDAPASVQESLARAAWNFILSNPRVAKYTSEAALKVATANTGIIDRETFEAEAWLQVSSAFDEGLPAFSDITVVADEKTLQTRQTQEAKPNEFRRQRANAVVWGGFWLWHFPDSFGAAWECWRAINQRAAEEFMFALAARLGEDSNAQLKQAAESGSVGLKTLKRLYEWVCSVVLEEEDVKHEEGRVYLVEERDQAQSFRGAIVPAISHARSEEAYAILEELRLKAAGPRAKYLRYVQFMMREEQAAKKPIPQTEYQTFETSFAPKVSDYTSFAMAVHADLLAVKSQIETGDFSLRRFFNALNFKRIKTDNDGLALEEDFQALLGSELNHAAAHRYTVTLESILPEGTRRDVLCQSGSFRATVELKMSMRWTLADYLEALEKQLQGQYMMAHNSKIGFFVVVLQKERTWKAPDGSRIKYSKLLEILSKRARELEVADSSLFLRVIGIDATTKEDFRAIRATKKRSGRAGVAKYADGNGNTWSGRGKKPKWIKDALAVGKTLEDLEAPISNKQ
jgi:hypothetical protein